MNQIIQSSNNLICRADAPHVVAIGLRTEGGVATRQVDAPRAAGSVGYRRSRPVEASNARGFQIAIRAIYIRLHQLFLMGQIPAGMIRAQLRSCSGIIVCG